MKYFHRTHAAPREMLGLAAEFFGTRLTPVQEEPQRPEGGHYTLVTVETDQVGESEADKLAKRFLTLAHATTHPSHRPIGAY